jgi:glutamine amidotransferase
MAERVTVVDYGVGNLVSVARALEKAGAEVTVSADATAIAAAERLVLPGVGAFRHCMDEIRGRGLQEAVLAFAATERPLLGICVGMQVMFEIGEEFGEQAGLGLLRGRVVRIDARQESGEGELKLPVIGWHRLDWRRDLDGGDAKLIRRNHFYFVHSFMAAPANPECILASYRYGASDVTAAVMDGAIVATQFHPEKSGAAGLAFLSWFLSR